MMCFDWPKNIVNNVVNVSFINPFKCQGQKMWTDNIQSDPYKGHCVAFNKKKS